MSAYISDWLNLIIRFAHITTGIAWIGASFYFIWLDNHLQKPPSWKAEKGIAGDLWAVHGGGFYEVSKYQLAPPEIPPTLHWFKWEAYTTWLSGFLLLSLMFYVGADTYLIDPRIAQLSQIQAIAIGIGSIIIGFAGYEILVRTKLKNHGLLLGLILMLFATALAFGLTQVFSARGAYMHMGAIIGTIMAGNVFFGIIPSQKELVNAVKAGEKPDPKYGLNAKLRSTHNTYTTLPILFIMISNHYPMTFNNHFNWLILIVIFFITAAVRQYFVLRHFGKEKPMILIAAIVATILLAIVISPKSQTPTQHVSKIADQRVQQIIINRCERCHSENPSDETFKIAPSGVIFTDMASIRRWAPRIKARVIDNKDMPFMNKTNMTDKERVLLSQWINQQSQTETKGKK